MADKTRVVTLDYNRLVARDDLSKDIEEAFGVDGLGVLTVANVPGLLEARNALLPLAFRLANLPEDVLQKYEHAASSYSFGWSRGKEKLDGNFDMSKGSFYANPQYDRPVDDEAIIAKYPAFIHPNIWPTEDIPELEAAFKTLGQLVVEVGKLVAFQCDAYVKSRCDTYESGLLERVINTSKCCKARLLHYYPAAAVHKESVTDASAAHDPFSSWCGWHNDHGSLTGLVSAQFMDANGNPIVNTDPTAGLFCRNRNSELHRVAIPVDHLAFQIGETMQIHSGGILQATPHAVRGSEDPTVARDTFAVFMEPNWDEQMGCPEGVDASATQSQSAIVNLPRGVSPLQRRWKPPMTFSDFTDATLSSYY